MTYAPPPEPERTQIDDLTVACHRRHDDRHDQAPPLVVLHGLGSSSHEFLYLADHPSLRHRSMLLIDLPGHGDSDKPDTWSYTIEDEADLLAKLLRQLGYTSADLAGHSMGGSIAVATAWRHPDLINRLAMAEPTLDPGTGVLSAHIARQPENRFVTRGYQGVMAEIRRQATGGNVHAARLLTTYSQASPVALHRSSVSLLAVRSPTFRDQLESLSIPRVMIIGDQTPPLAPPLTDPAITRLVVERAGHMMMIDNPDGFARAVAQALMI